MWSGAAASPAAQAPALEDLAFVQPELAEVCTGLSDAELADFAQRVAYEEAYRSLGLEGVDWDGVLTTLGRALEGRPTLESEWIEFSWMHGAARVAGGAWSRAEPLLRAALERSPPDGPREGWIHASLAQVAMSEERWIEALDELSLSLASSEFAVDPAGLRTYVEGLRAEVWIQIGMPELARPTVEALWARERDGSDPFKRWSAFELWLECLLVGDEYPVLADLERELTESGWLDRLDAHDRARAARRFAQVLVERGQFQGAANVEARRRLIALLEEGTLGERETRWALEGLALAALDARASDEAADAIERLRALDADGARAPRQAGTNADVAQLAALDALAALQSEQPGMEILDRHLASVRSAWERVRSGWANLPTRDGGIGYLFHARRQLLIEALLALELRRNGPQLGGTHALEWLVEAQQVSTLARRLSAGRESFSEVRAELLPPGRGLIAWIPLRSRSFAVAVDGTRALLVELPVSVELAARATEFAQAVAMRVRAGAAGDAAEFERTRKAAGAAFLPAPLLEFARDWRELYVCGLDDTGYLPFELLDDGEGGTQGARRAIVRAPSIPAVLVLSRRFSPPGAAAGAPVRAALVLADRPDETLARDYGVGSFDVRADLAQSLREGWEAAPLEELRGAQARADAVERIVAPPCAFAHVVAHGVERRAERPQGLLLARGGEAPSAVFAEHVERWPVPPLLLLSVCATARAQARRGDGSRSDLVAALFTAGAAGVAAASAELDLAPTLRVGARVQARLQEGLPIGHALREARASFAEKPAGREWLAAHLLQVHGAGFDARLPGSSARRPTRWWSAALGLAVALAGLVAWRVARRRA